MSGLSSGSGAGRDWSFLPKIPPMLWQPTTPASAARIRSLRIVVVLCRTPFRTHELSPRRQAEGRFDPAGCGNFAGRAGAQPEKVAQVAWSADYTAPSIQYSVPLTDTRYGRVMTCASVFWARSSP